MKKIFGRWKEDIQNVREELILRNDKVYGKAKRLDERIERLERIVKYSKEEPTCRIERYWGDESFCIHKYRLYLYINKEEYIVNLKDLHRICTQDIRSINVSGSVATVEIEEGNLVHIFTIEYEKDNYIRRCDVKKNEEPEIVKTPKDKETMIWKDQ